ncbi:MAG: universal stress protein [Bacteriovorax sp.]
MKVLWGFDPFGENKKLQTMGKNVLKFLAGSGDQVKVVYVASNAEVNLATAYNIDKEKRYTDFPRKLIKNDLNALGLKKYAVEVLPTISMSISASVKLLSQYAQKTQTDFIVIATNSKKFLPRLVFGSFAESLVHLSKTDVLIYHQKTKVHERLPKNILYAHDFSAKGSAGLERAMVYAKKWNSILHVIHVTNAEFTPIQNNSEAEAYCTKILKFANKVEKSIEAEGIKCNIHLEPSQESPANVIIKKAKKLNAEVIIVAAKSGNLAAFLGGSVSRNIMRESSLLTLILKV